MFVLRDVGKLYDGSGPTQAAVHEHVDVVVEGARIQAVMPHDRERAHERGVTVVEAAGLTVTPGMIDCHGHVTALGLHGADLDEMAGGPWLLYVEKILYTTLVDGGVTTLRDVGGATHLIKRWIDEGRMIGPRLKIAICMLSTTGGHADFRGPDRCHAEISRLWPPGPGRPSSIVDGPWECRKRVREIAACGADLIKVCASPGVASPTDRLEHRDFTAEELRAICDEASARGLRVAAHAHSQNGIELAIDCGVHDIQHISFMDARLVELAHARGCTVTPTSWVVAELQTARFDPFVMEKVKQVGEHHRRAVEHAASGGLKILAGTDAVMRGMHGRNYLEIAHLAADGLPPLSAWWGATGLAAEEVGQDDAGVVAPGRRADLLVFSEDVVADPARLHRCRPLEVLKDGVAHRGALAGLPQRGYADTVAATLREDARR